MYLIVPTQQRGRKRPNVLLTGNEFNGTAPSQGTSLCPSQVVVQDSQLTRGLKDCNSTVVKLRSELQQNVFIKPQTIVKYLNVQDPTLVNQLGVCRTSVKNLTKEIETYRTMTVDNDKTLDQLKTKLAALEDLSDRHVRIQKQLEQLKLEHTGQIDQITKSNAALVGRLEKELETAKTELVSLASDKDNKGIAQQSRILTLENALSDANERAKVMGAVQTKLDTVVDERDRLEAARSDLQVKLSKVMSQLDQAQIEYMDDIRKKQSQITALNDTIDTMTNNATLGKDEMSRLQTQLETKSDELYLLQNQFKDLEDTRTRLNTEAANREAQLVAQLEAANANAITLQTLLDTSKGQLNTCNDNIQRLDSEINTLRAQIDNMTHEREKLDVQENEKQEEIKVVTTTAVQVCDELRAEMTNKLTFIGKQVDKYDNINSKLAQDAMSTLGRKWIQFKSQLHDIIEQARYLVNNVQVPSVVSPTTPDSAIDMSPPVTPATSTGQNIINMDCDQIKQEYGRTLSINNELLSIDRDLSNFYEDISGSVRVYIKLKPSQDDGKIPLVLTKDGRNVKFGEGCGGVVVNNKKSFGPFFGVMPESYNNIDIYRGCSGLGVDTNFKVIGGDACCKVGDDGEKDPAGLCRVIGQIASGYHVVLFGYGTSGSGKTYTLFGDAGRNVPGLVELAMANGGAQSIRVKNVYELSLKSVDYAFRNLTSQVNFIYGENKLLDELARKQKMRVQDLRSSFALFINGQGDNELNITQVPQKLGTMEYLLDNNGSVDASAMFNLSKLITLFRSTEVEPHIKATPNNPTSSRAHLFMTLEFIYENGTKGYLTVVDMGGVESPLDIFNTFYTKTNHGVNDAPRNIQNNILSYLSGINLNTTNFKRIEFTTKSPSIAWYDGPNKDKFVQDLMAYNEAGIRKIMHEGIFINETINQLVWYFIEKIHGTERARKEIKKHKSKASGREADVAYSPTELFTDYPNTPRGDSVGMYKLLSLLDNYQKKPSKFVMMFMVRGEQMYCNTTFQSLSVADKIKST